MSAPKVDVLAVLRGLSARLDRVSLPGGDLSGPEAAGLSVACRNTVDAVAELIERHAELVRAGKRLRNTIVQTRGVRGMDDHDAALRASDAALANVGGQP